MSKRKSLPANIDDGQWRRSEKVERLSKSEAWIAVHSPRELSQQRLVKDLRAISEMDIDEEALQLRFTRLKFI